MEIDSQQMDDLLRIQRQQQGLSVRQQTADGVSGNFEALFNEALTPQNTTQTPSNIATPGMAQSGMISQMLLNPIEGTQGIDSDTDLLQSSFTAASGTLDLFDSYARTLASGTESGNLRNAYSILENIDSQVSQLKTNASQMQQQNPGLNSLVNDLEIMATTERIKFNRGDYA